MCKARTVKRCLRNLSLKNDNSKPKLKLLFTVGVRIKKEKFSNKLSKNFDKKNVDSQA